MSPLASVIAGGRRRAGGGGGGSFTRFYLPSSGSAAVSPAISAAWTGSDSLVVRPLGTAKASSSMTGKQSTAAGNGNHRAILQFVSAPLAAQTISGNVKGQIRGYRLGGRPTEAQAALRVVSNDGTTERAVLRARAILNATTFSGYPLPASLTNVRWDSAALSSYACAAGDRLVLELGIGAVASWGSGDFDGELSYGDDHGTDLPENQTETGALNPWIEFSVPIFLQ